ncbi:di-N-acetylchitobiase [Nematostella vectensis]|uniref:di-N-acetylchitobiase n=1 Tax=Nematostella vectensis TaxID=45351 RepID=UPI002077134B|nr:di-N-acetylchitobiase [Nematostella vectensis]
MAFFKRWLAVICVFSFAISLTLCRKCPCKEESLCEPITRPPGKECLVWTTTPNVWRKTDFNAPGYNWSKITTIGMFREWDDELFCTAHSKGVRVVLVSGFPVEKLSNSQVRKDWIKNKTTEAKENFADGINIDIEGPIEKGSKEVTLLTKLVNNVAKAFRKEFKHTQISFDAAWSPDCIDGRCYDLKAIVDIVDFMVIMAYDQQSQIKEGPCIAKANSPYSQTLEGVQQYLKLNISSNKLVLGLPWYGYDYPCEEIDEKNDICFIKKVPFRGVNCSDAAGTQIPYATVNDLLMTRTDTGRKWSLKSLSPYFWYSDHVGNPHQVWYDDPSSLTFKYRIANMLDLKGVAIWNADLLDYSGLMRANVQTQDMWNKLHQAMPKSGTFGCVGQC